MWNLWKINFCLLPLFFPRVWYLSLVFSYLLLTAALLRVSRTENHGLTGTAVFYLVTSLPSSWFISRAHFYQQMGSVLQAPLGWGWCQENKEQRQKHWCHYSHGLQKFTGQTSPSGRTLPQHWDAHGSQINITWLYLCQRGSQGAEYCASIAHYSFLVKLKVCIFWRTLHISRVPVKVSQTALSPPNLKFPYTFKALLKELKDTLVPDEVKKEQSDSLNFKQIELPSGNTSH